MNAPFCFTFEVPERGFVVRVRHDGRALLGIELRDRRSRFALSAPRCELERHLEADLHRYFVGRQVEFRFRLTDRSATPFQREVWKALRRIPCGEVRTYGWVARAIGRPGAARAVGGACRANAFPIIVPCHRVVAADGSLGGYSSGLKWKRLLLSIERALSTGQFA